MINDKNLSSEKKVINSFNNLQASLSVDLTQDIKLGFLFDNENHYQLYKDALKKRCSNNTNLSFMQVANNLLSISSQFKKDYFVMSDFQEKYYLGQLNLRPSVAEREYNKMLNTILVNLCNSLSETGYIDTLLSKHNKKCVQHYVSILKLTPEQIRYELDKNHRCNITDSYVKLAFWVNKFIKFINIIEEASIYHFTTNNMDISKFPESEINRLLFIAKKKKDFLTSIYLNSYNDKQEGSFIDSYKDSYSELLKDTFIDSNNLEQEYRFLKLFESTKDDVYAVKNQLSNTIINDCLIDYKTHKASPYIKNWGITEDSKDHTKCILAIHLPTALFPCTFHLPKHSLYETMQFLKINQIDIPKYDISKYFTTSTGELFPINIICSPSDEQKAKLKNVCRDSNAPAPILNTIYGHLNGCSYIRYNDTMHFEL